MKKHLPSKRVIRLTTPSIGGGRFLCLAVIQWRQKTHRLVPVDAPNLDLYKSAKPSSMWR